MSRSNLRILSIIAELLMLLPGLVVAVTWVVIVLGGLLEIWDLRMHQMEIGRAMLFVLVASLPPTFVGFALLILCLRLRVE